MRRLWVPIATAGLVALAIATTAASSPTSPAFDFCPGSVVTKFGIETDAAAGVTYSSSVFMPTTGGPTGIYFSNDGPGPITFLSPAWSTKATGPIAAGSVPLTPGGSVFFSDGGWGGTFGEGVDLRGCISFGAAPKGTAHMDLSFMRGSTVYTVRVNVHFR